MTEADIDILLARAREPHLEARPQIASDDWLQLITSDFKEFVRVSGETEVRTSPRSH